MEEAMDLTPEQKLHISDYIRSNLQEWITESAANRVITERELETRERMVRVEESMDRTNALMQQGFDNMRNLFDQMEKRFEQVDKRFEQVDKRFNQMFAFITTGFVMLGTLITAFQIFG